ncbi:NAD(P)-dependent oxidoreductase [Bacillus sp. JJ1562]|uniref:NAD(P)-dependent oxidoreductase n=1 Tax=Bacillus sp. JJ1562 TaxID=3122960 RepID=UPI00300399AA
MYSNEWRIGIIGLGKMGGAVAEAIINAEMDVTVYDVNPKAVTSLVEIGANAAIDIVDVAKSSNIILTILPNTEIVSNVYESLLENAVPETRFIDLSTIDPNFIRTLNESVQRKNCILVDLPVSGSPQEARDGNLVLLAGCESLEVLEGIEPLLKCFGHKIHFIGKPGDAKAVKIVNNLMTLGNIAVAAEAFSIGEKFGINPNLLFNVLNQSGGRSHQFSKRFPFVLERDFDGRFSIELGEKDLGIGINLSKSLGIPTPIASLIQQIYSITKYEGYGKEDIVSVVKIYEEWGSVSK